MSAYRTNFDDQGDEIPFKNPPAIPQEWEELISKLNPITGVVVWEILTGNLSPATITLAQSSPDWGRYTAIRIVAGGNPDLCDEIADMARDDLDEIFIDLIPNYISRRTMH